MKKDEVLFIKITKTYAITPPQARQALKTARLQAEGITYLERDPDGKETRVSGNDYLAPDASPDVAAAVADINDPVGVLGIEEVEAVSRTLSPMEVAKLTAGWDAARWSDLGGPNK